MTASDPVVDYGYDDYGYGDGAPDSSSVHQSQQNNKHPAVDYGYGTPEMMNGGGVHGDHTETERGEDYDYGYGDGAPDSQAPPPPTPTRKPKQSLSLFVGQQQDQEPDYGYGDNAGGGGGAAPKPKKRGRRLSMFAFAGQDDEEEVIKTQFHEEHHHKQQHKQKSNTHRSNNINSSDHSRGGGSVVRRTLSDDSKSGGGNSSGGGGLGSFFLGGGSGGGSEVDGAATTKKGGRRRTGRRLSMMAFADGAGANEDEVMEEDTGGMLAHVNLNYNSVHNASRNNSAHNPNTSSNNSISKGSHTTGGSGSQPSQQQQQQPPAPSRRILKRSTSDTGFNRQPSFRRIKTTDVVTNGEQPQQGAGGSSNHQQKSSKYATTQLPAEYLQDAQQNKPVTRKMSASTAVSRQSATASSRPGKVPVTRHSASAYAPAGHKQQKQQQQEKPRTRQQRRSSFGGTSGNNGVSTSQATPKHLQSSSPTNTPGTTNAMPQAPPSPRRFSGGALVESQSYRSPTTKQRTHRSRSETGRNPPPAHAQQRMSAGARQPNNASLSASQHQIHSSNNNTRAHNNNSLSRSEHGYGRLSSSSRNLGTGGPHLVSPASRSNASSMGLGNTNASRSNMNTKHYQQDNSMSPSSTTSPQKPQQPTNIKMLSMSPHPSNALNSNNSAYGSVQMSPQKQRNRLTMQNIPEGIQPKPSLQKSPYHQSPYQHQNNNNDHARNNDWSSAHELQSLTSVSDHDGKGGDDNATTITSATQYKEVDMKEVDELQQYMAKLDDTMMTTSTAPGSSAASSSAMSVGTTSSASSSMTHTLYRKEAAAMAREAAAASAAGAEIGSHNMSLLYILARCCEWDAVLEELAEYPRDAKVVSEKDGTTALHLAVMSRTNPVMRDGKAGAGVEPAPLHVIQALVKACPEAAIIRCTKKRYTPLCYACLVADANYDMEDCRQIVQILLQHAPHSPFVFTDDGFSALDIHILSYSQLHKQHHHQQKEASSMASFSSSSSTVVLQALLDGEPSLADARVYRNKIRGPLELLYRCNIEEFKEAVEEEAEAGAGEQSDQDKVRHTQQRFFGNGEVLSEWWAWKWSLMLLKFASISAGQEVDPFNAVQAAARLVGCPLPILALAISSFPEQVMDRDPTGDIYNLPLHEVCSWRADSENVAGDPFIATRKFKAMRMLLEQFPEAARMTNNCGETPLQLAVETCTPWHGGLEALVESCPKALKFPRKLRITDNGLSLAVANHSAIDSLGTVDSDEPDPLEPMENMYPFLVSAVLGGVSQNKRRPPVSFSDEMADEHYANLERKSLQAVRAVFGLLRARPEVLEKYRALVRREERAKKSSSRRY